jgi:hypothetical protein
MFFKSDVLALWLRRRLDYSLLDSMHLASLSASFLWRKGSPDYATLSVYFFGEKFPHSSRALRLFVSRFQKIFLLELRMQSVSSDARLHYSGGDIR